MQRYLKKRLDELREYRSQGLRSLSHVPVYNTYKLKRLNRVSSCHMASLFTCLSRLDVEQQLSEMGREQQMRDWFRRFVMAERTLNGTTTAEETGDTPTSTLSIGESTVTSAGNPIPGSSTTTTTTATVATPMCYPATHMKYKHNPLRIEEYPDSDKLDEDEKEFCRVARLQPVVYLRVKAALIGENKKAGFCTYARARKIAGIDVNKTRLIHNFLLKLNLINAALTKSESLENV